ncbi:MAG: MMPL family transporter, partial [Actinomycetota bacterium]|nr:MMPL family transporter [Actinomycetota bacterium]
MGFAGIRYTVMGMALIPLMLGIDIAYSIHVLTRYYEERDKRKGAEDSAVSSVVTVGIAVFLAAATTIFGFLSFSISDLPPIRQFGFLCLGGVLFGFLLSITMLPAALVIRDRRRGVRETRRVEEHLLLDWLDRGLARLSLLAERHRLPVWIGCLVLVVACGLSVLGISTSADFRTFVPQDLPSYRSFTRIEEYFGGQDTTVALLEGEDLLSPPSLRKMDEFVSAVLDHPRNLTPEGERKYFRPEKTNSLPGIFRALKALSSAEAAGANPAGEAVQEAEPGDWVPVSREEAEVLLSRAEEAFGFESTSLLTPDGKSSLVAFEVPFVNEEGEKEMAFILRDAASAVSATGTFDIRLTGMPLIISDALDKLFTTQLESGGLALLLCALLVMVVFRSMAYGLTATSVVFLAILLEVGLLRLIGWPLDIMTVMIASLVIGAGIDFGIHVAHRFREELYENRLGPEEAVNATVRNVGTALISAAVTTSGAFLILAISSFSPLRRFGVITALALASACFAALVLEPTFLTTVATRLDRRVRAGGKGSED